MEIKQLDSVYLVEGKEVPRVTNIIKSAGLSNFDMVPKDLLERGADFGKAVHTACHQFNTDTLDWANLDPNVEPYLEGWIKFRKDVKWAKTVKFSEKRCFSKLYGFAGTLDDFFTSGNIIDIKTGTVNKTVGVQLAAYKQALIEMGYKVKDRFGVVLGEGKYSLIETKPDDWNVFTACLKIYRFKARNSITK